MNEKVAGPGNSGYGQSETHPARTNTDSNTNITHFSMTPPPLRYP